MLPAEAAAEGLRATWEESARTDIISWQLRFFHPRPLLQRREEEREEQRPDECEGGECDKGANCPIMSHPYFYRPSTVVVHPLQRLEVKREDQLREDVNKEEREEWVFTVSFHQCVSYHHRHTNLSRQLTNLSSSSPFYLSVHLKSRRKGAKSNAPRVPSSSRGEGLRGGRQPSFTPRRGPRRTARFLPPGVLSSSRTSWYCRETHPKKAGAGRGGRACWRKGEGKGKGKERARVEERRGQGCRTGGG